MHAGCTLPPLCEVTTQPPSSRWRVLSLHIPLPLGAALQGRLHRVCAKEGLTAAQTTQCAALHMALQVSEHGSSKVPLQRRTCTSFPVAEHSCTEETSCGPFNKGTATKKGTLVIGQLEKGGSKNFLCAMLRAKRSRWQRRAGISKEEVTPSQEAETHVFKYQLEQVVVARMGTTFPRMI